MPWFAPNLSGFSSESPLPWEPPQSRAHWDTRSLSQEDRPGWKAAGTSARVWRQPHLRRADGRTNQLQPQRGPEMFKSKWDPHLARLSRQGSSGVPRSFLLSPSLGIAFHKAFGYQPLPVPEWWRLILFFITFMRCIVSLLTVSKCGF